MAKNITTSATPIHQLREATANPIPISSEPRYSGLRVYAYGPDVASASFLRTCPEASARISRPGAIKMAPSSRNRHVGCASQKYSTAKANPSGTLMRRATLDHSAMGILRRKQLPRCVDDRFHADLHHGFVRLRAPSVRRLALRIPQHDAARSIRTVSRGISWTENRGHRNAQCRGEMHRPRVSADEQARAARQ